MGLHGSLCFVPRGREPFPSQEKAAFTVKFRLRLPMAQIPLLQTAVRSTLIYAITCYLGVRFRLVDTNLDRASLRTEIPSVEKHGAKVTEGR